jgi:hypothetical protein
MTDQISHQMPGQAPLPGPLTGPLTGAGGWPAPLQAARVRHRSARRHRAWRTPPVLQPGVLT